MAGYSGTPLARKLGLKPGGRLALVGAPEGFERLLEPLPEGARVERLAAAPARRAGLDLGLVDNKVCAVDEVWSGSASSIA